MFSSTMGEGKCFLGDWQTFELAQGEYPSYLVFSSVKGRIILPAEAGSSMISTSDWPGDRLVISSNNGNLYIQYVDEEKLEPAFLKSIKGLFNSNAETKQLLGEANRIMKDKIGGRHQY